MWSQRMHPGASRLMAGRCWRSRGLCQRYCSTPCSFVCSPKSMMTQTNCISSWLHRFVSHNRKRWSLIANVIILPLPSSTLERATISEICVITSLGENLSKVVSHCLRLHTHTFMTRCSNHWGQRMGQITGWFTVWRRQKTQGRKTSTERHKLYPAVIATSRCPHFHLHGCSVRSGGKDQGQNHEAFDINMQVNWVWQGTNLQMMAQSHHIYCTLHHVLKKTGRIQMYRTQYPVCLWRSLFSQSSHK